MRKLVSILGLAAAVAAAPSLALAGRCEHHAHNRRVAGTVIGAGAGALIGGALGHGAAAPLLGAAGGAVVGNQVAREKCYHHVAYYHHRRYRHHYG
jgi:osmotically inducible lipoprotein OsmB